MSALPKTPDLVSPLTPFKSQSGFSFNLSPLPLPSGVKNIDVEDGESFGCDELDTYGNYNCCQHVFPISFLNTIVSRIENINIELLIFKPQKIPLNETIGENN